MQRCEQFNNYAGRLTMGYGKKYKILLMMLILSSCGGAGHIQFYDFIAPKSEVKKELTHIINFEGKYSAPAHWNDYEIGKDSEDIFVYFGNSPRELYCVGFRNYDDQPKYKDKTVLALVAVFDGHLWHSSSDLSRSEENRVKKRFQTEVLSKMKFYYSDN